jgi:hypothetical protein
VSRFEQTAALPFGTISTGLINKGHMIEEIAYRGDALSGKNSPVPLSSMEKLPTEGQQQLLPRTERPLRVHSGAVDIALQVSSHANATPRPTKREVWQFWSAYLEP